MITPHSTIENHMNWHLVVDDMNQVHTVEEYHTRWMHTSGGIMDENNIKIIARVKGSIKSTWIPRSKMTLLKHSIPNPPDDKPGWFISAVVIIAVVICLFWMMGKIH